MKINALMLDTRDNVVTCVEEVKAGSEVVYRGADGLASITAIQDIPYCHKVALHDVNEGEAVIKYGEMIGRATAPIPAGHLVNENNILSVPRNYDDEMLRGE